MSRNLPRPYFPVPPVEYQQIYFADLIRAFSVYIEQQANPGEGRNTFTVFTALQTDDSGLEPGAVFEHGGYLKVARANTPHVRGSQAQAAAGEVTVVTT